LRLPPYAVGGGRGESVRLVEKGLAKRHKKGTYLIERAAVEEVLTALKEWI
jgi:predicted transcriptional regulator of viral defense system